MRPLLATMLLAAGLVGMGKPVAGQPVMSAGSADDITLDGRLEETAWQQATPVSDFKQFEPAEGSPASQRTEVRVLYGPSSVYIGAHLYDEQPDLVERALGRRDQYNRADWFIVSIDSYFDRRTAYNFGVNAAGVQFDAVQMSTEGGNNGRGPEGPEGMDPSWDAIWYSAVRQSSDGWIAEIRIPYSMLRFPHAEAQTWGIHFIRRIPRLGEVSEWPLVPRTERANLVAQFGRLEGIRGIHPRRNVQVRPYTMSRLQTDEDPGRPGEMRDQHEIDLGGDLKIGLGSNLMLDATVNPDFGQVESDPAVLNLTAFETFYEERRPFFVEGSQIFEFPVGPGQLLYTRRIGAEAPIVGAVKLSGRTARGLSLGVLGATTGHDFSPSQHFAVSRLSQQLGTFSRVGGALTFFDSPSLSGDGRHRTIAGGADWDLRLLQNRWGIEGFASVLHRNTATADQEGTTALAGKIWGNKREGAWRFTFGVDVIGKDFNPNDLGQMFENNFIATPVGIEHDINGGRPFGPFQRASLSSFSMPKYSYSDGTNLGQEIGLDSEWMFRGFESMFVMLEMINPLGGYDVYETRGLGPWARPFQSEMRAIFMSDFRKNWQIGPGFAIAVQDGGGLGYEVQLEGEWNLGTRLSFEAEAEIEWEKDMLAWTSNESFRHLESGWQIGTDARPPSELGPDEYIAIDGSGVLDGMPSLLYAPVFGRRDTRALDFTLHSNITFLPNLSLQLYGQLFVANGRYRDFQLLRDRDNLASFASYPKRDDFAFNSLQANTVLRWEYRPGSTLYLVWTHGRRANDQLNPLAPWGPAPSDRSIGEQISDTWGVFPDNVFLIKLSYAFLR